MENPEPQSPHLLFLPFPAQGHVKPTLKLAELLSNAKFQVTFVNTEHIHRRLLHSIDIDAFHRRFPNFNFKTFPDGLPPSHPRASVYLLASIDSHTVNALRLLLDSDLGRTTTPMIADAMMSSSAVVLAEEFIRIRVLSCYTASACSTWSYFHLSKLIELGEVPLQAKLA